MDAKTFESSRNANLKALMTDTLKNQTFDEVGYEMARDDLELYVNYDPLSAQIQGDYFGQIDRSGLAGSSPQATGQSGRDARADATAEAAAAAASRAAQATQMGM